MIQLISASSRFSPSLLVAACAYVSLEEGTGLTPAALPTSVCVAAGDPSLLEAGDLFSTSQELNLEACVP